MRCFAPLPLLLTCSLLLACGGDDPTLPSGPIALYDDKVASELTPYPSDRYTAADPTSPTGLRLAIQSADTLDLVADPSQAEALAELDQRDGFSTLGGFILSFDQPLDVRGMALIPGEDPATAAPLRDAYDYAQLDSPLLLVNVDPQSSEQGKLHGVIPHWWEQAADDYYTQDEFTLIVEPAEPLLPRTRYLLAARTQLRGRDGQALRRAPHFEALLRGDVEADYGEKLQAGIDIIAARGIPRDSIAIASVFTTGSVHDALVATAGRLRAEPPPVVLEDWSLETPLAPDGRVRFKARYQAPEFRAPLPDGRWHIEDGLPITQGNASLEVFVAFSDADSSAKRPIVIYGHGLGGDKDGCWGTADRLAPINAAVFAIDSPHHGSRSSGGSSLAATLNFFGVEGTDFVMGRARDNFRQMAMDQLQLLRLIDSLDTLDILPPGAPDGIPDLDTSRIVYIGHSFGAVQSPTIMALAPEISQGVWNVGGGHLTVLLRESGTIGLLLDSLRPPGASDGVVARFLAVLQGILDPGDPANYAAYVTQRGLPGVEAWEPRDVLLQEVIGDTIVPNSASRALARAAGLALMDPLQAYSGATAAAGPLQANLPLGNSGAISQFDRINGGELAVHGELIFAPEGKAQYLQFLSSGLQGDAAQIPKAY